MFHATAAATAVSAIILSSSSSQHHHFASFVEPILQQHVVSTASTTTSTNHLTALALLRGGASGGGGEDVTAANFDIDRVRMRLDGLNSYAVISTLTMNACLGLYFKTPKQQIDIGSDSWSEKLAKIIFLLSTITSIVAASYTTVVFTLLGLYSKTALGLTSDHGPFVEFFAQTAIFRQVAFTAFCMSLVAFQTCFITSLFLSHDVDHKNNNKSFSLRWYATGLASVLSIFCFWQWGLIINLAGRLLFKH
jgi:hypothetical protein